MHNQVITTIGSNLVDIFVRSAAFQIQPTQEGVLLCQTYGDKIDVDSFVLRSGGGAGNTAVGFARLGFTARTISELGKDVWAEFVIDELKQEGVDTQFLVQEKKEETGGSILLMGKDGGRTALVHRGAAALLDPQDISETALADSDWVHLSNIGGQVEALKRIFELVNSNAQLRLSWNPGKKEISALVEGRLARELVKGEILFVNDSEWKGLESVQAHLHQSFEFIVITRGRDGGEVWSNGQQVHTYSIAQVEPVDETGAGDAFAVGYVASYLRGLEPASACEFAKRNAASVVQQVGAKPGLLRSFEAF